MTIFELDIFGITISPSYYGLMYALGFLAGYYIIKKRGFISGKKLDDLFLYIVLGVILGGRLGYILFYNFDSYINSPIDIFKIWEGGMSFHGGVIGVIIAMLLFSKKYSLDFLKLSDQITLVLPIGLGLGRIGNYLNGELLGYTNYNSFLAYYKDGVGYFPSTLLEALFEGLILFIILNYFYNKKNLTKGQIASLFLIFYSIFRIFIEAFFRTPDPHIGYIIGFLTMGIILSLPMLIIGLILFYKFKK